MFVNIVALFSESTPDEIEHYEAMGLPVPANYFSKNIVVGLSPDIVYYDVKANVVIDGEEVELNGTQVYTPSMEFTTPMSKEAFSEMILNTTELQEKFIDWLDENG